MVKKFALVYWVNNDKFGTVPVTAAKNGGDTLHVGPIAQIKYGSTMTLKF